MKLINKIFIKSILYTCFKSVSDDMVGNNKIISSTGSVGFFRSYKSSVERFVDGRFVNNGFIKKFYRIFLQVMVFLPVLLKVILNSKIITDILNNKIIVFVIKYTRLCWFA